MNDKAVIYPRSREKYIKIIHMKSIHLTYAIFYSYHNHKATMFHSPMHSQKSHASRRQLDFVHVRIMYAAMPQLRNNQSRLD